MLTQRRADEDDAMRRMKTEFLVQLDGAGNRREGHVLVMGATNRPQDLDEGARRRFAKRLYLPLPNQPARETLLRTLVAKNSHSLTDDDFVNLSRDTEGYSGADLKNLCNDVSYSPMRTQSSEAWMSMSISPNDVPLIPISYEHFCRSLRITSPSVGQEDLQAYVDWSNAHGTKPDFLGN
jgi:SpoVK/Ycf46/Vps4 family AAA+-type ATPase